MAAAALSAAAQVLALPGPSNYNSGKQMQSLFQDFAARIPVTEVC